jgi:ABC-type microcin C transport system permease subunit YejE
MDENQEGPLRDVLARALAESDMAIVWGLVITVVVIATAMVIGLIGYQSAPW